MARGRAYPLTPRFRAVRGRDELRPAVGGRGRKPGLRPPDLNLGAIWRLTYALAKDVEYRLAGSNTCCDCGCPRRLARALYGGNYRRIGRRGCRCGTCALRPSGELGDGSGVDYRHRVAGLCGLLAYAAWSSLWLAILIALMAAGVLGAVLGLLVWIVNPTPVDLDAIARRARRLLWQLRDTGAWRRLSDWVERRTASHAA
jgi:hypothetical protein